MAIAFHAPPARRRIVGGEEIAELVISGRVVPKWILAAFNGIAFVASYWIFLKMLDMAWPERPRDEPAESSTGSARDFERLYFWRDMAAAEFLEARPPDAIEEMFGVEVWVEREIFFRQQAEWLHGAPAATLHELLPAAEVLLQKSPGDEDVIEALCQAMKGRGIPSEEDLFELAMQLGDTKLVEALGG